MSHFSSNITNGLGNLTLTITPSTTNTTLKDKVETITISSGGGLLDRLY